MRQNQTMFESVKNIHFENIPEELQQLQQWVMWRYEEKKGGGKSTKVPYFSVSQRANTTDSKTWLKFHEAINFLKNDFFDGIGFVFTEEDEYVGIDLDHCNEEGGLNAYANEIVSLMDSYTEYSPSGTGLHIIVKVSKEIKFDSRKDNVTGTEVYQKGRYFTFTAETLFKSDIRYRDQEVQTLLEEHLHPSSVEQFELVPLEEVQGYTSNKDDQVILQELFSSQMTMPQSSMTFGHYNRSLFENGHQGDKSSDDWYFAKQLAFLCSGDLEQMNRIFMSSALYRPEKWEKVHYSNGDTYGQRTLYNAVCAKKKDIDKRKNAVSTVSNSANENQFLIPYGYGVKNGALYQIIEKTLRDGDIERKEMLICRQAPYISRSFTNAETGDLYHEITWVDNQREHTTIVSASSLAIRKELVQLSNKSLAVTENNAKALITYFDTFNMVNTLKREHLVSRIGHIKNVLIHPLLADGVTIMPSDLGEKQILEAFQMAGASEDWIKHVLNPIQQHPKALLMLLASFTSVILKDLKLDPFIIDFAGETSNGKTTLLKACASVWGTRHLMSEWNITKVAAERKATFLNSFPLILDDSRKGNEKSLKDFVYNFSGGRSKGRGSLTGSQQEFTWQNILISTGEASLNAYAEQMGGVAARIIAIEGIPFPSVEPQFFTALHNDVEAYYGTIGLEFITHWQKHKEALLQEFGEYIGICQRKAEGNPVIARVARNYAALIFTGKLLNVFFKANIDLMALYELFDELVSENKALDKPKQLLQYLLQDLDANRKAIYYDYEPHGVMKALYKHNTLWITPSFLKEFLGVEEKSIRSAWLTRGYTMKFENRGKEVDYKQVRAGKQKFSGIGLDVETIKELGFDFSEE